MMGARKRVYEIGEIARMRKQEQPTWKDMTLWLFAVRGSDGKLTGDSLVSAELQPTMPKGKAPYTVLARATGKDRDEAFKRLKEAVDKEPLLAWVRETAGWKRACRIAEL